MITAICAKAKTIDQLEKAVGKEVIDLIEYNINEAIVNGEMEVTVTLPASASSVKIAKTVALCDMIGYQVTRVTYNILRLSWGGYR